VHAAVAAADFVRDYLKVACEPSPSYCMGSYACRRWNCDGSVTHFGVMWNAFGSGFRGRGDGRTVLEAVAAQRQHVFAKSSLWRGLSAMQLETRLKQRGHTASACGQTWKGSRRKGTRSSGSTRL
jgi:hypothetical protein